MLPALEIERIPAEDEALRPAIRAFLDAELPHTSAAQRSRSWMGYDEAFSRKLAAAGFVGMMLPREYGGGGRSPYARFVVVEELLARGAPVAAHWIADRQSGPLINRFGTEEQRRFYLPRICRGEAFFCIGMSEPNSGSDLASVRSRAVWVDGGWKLNGSKIWTTIAHHAHYMIALVRTSGAPEDRHKGLSQVVIDLKTPGVKVRPIRDQAGDEHFNEVHFEDVMLPEDALVGTEGGGWAQVNAELAFERSGPERLQSSIVLLDELIAWQRARGGNDAIAAAEIGAIQARLVVLRAMCLAVNGKVARGEQPLLEAAVVKDLGTEVEQAIGTMAARLCAADPADPAPASLRDAVGYVLQMAPTFSLRGGTREILRGMIARGLGLR